MTAKRIQEHTAAASLVGTELAPLAKLSTTITHTGTGISADASERKFTRSSGSWSGEGFEELMSVRSSGWTGGAANNKRSRIITSIIEPDIFFAGDDGADIVDDAGGEAVTITAWVPVQAALTDIVALGGTGGVELKGLTFTSDTGSTADSDPGASLFKWNHATQSAATFLYLDDLTLDSVNLDTFYGALGPSGYLYLQQAGDATKWQLYRWTATPTDGTGYWKFAVTALAQGGAIADNETVYIDFASSATAAALQGDGLDVDAAGFRGVPWNSQSGNYTTVAADASKGILHPSGAGAGDTFTVDSHANVPYEGGTIILVGNLAADAVTIAVTTQTLTNAANGATGPRTLGQNGLAWLIKMPTDNWLIIGTQLT